MTRSEAIESAARDLLADCERETIARLLLMDNVRAALALPPDPDWQAIAHQLAAALVPVLGAYRVAMQMHGRNPADFEASSDVAAAHAALALMPTEPKP